MRILLTNDDGVASDGLWAVARGLARVGHLTVIGTAEDWSGGSASVRVAVDARLAPYRDAPDDLGPGVKSYVIDAAPGGAILVGLMSDLFEPFDFVVSGANWGINVGSDLAHSGTLGAAVTAFQRGLSAFGISTRRGEPQRWDGVSDVAERIARWLGARSGPPLLLNVNVPNLSFADMRGASIVPPAPWGHLDRAGFSAHPVPEGGWLIGIKTGPPRPYPNDPNTDAGAVVAGKIAISPVSPIGGPPPASVDDLDDLVRALIPTSAAPSIIQAARARSGEGPP